MSLLPVTGYSNRFLRKKTHFGSCSDSSLPKHKGWIWVTLTLSWIIKAISKWFGSFIFIKYWPTNSLFVSLEAKYFLACLKRGYFWEYKDTAAPFTVTAEWSCCLKCAWCYTQLLASAKGVVWLEEGWESQEQQLSHSLMDCSLRSWDYTQKKQKFSGQEGWVYREERISSWMWREVKGKEQECKKNMWWKMRLGWQMASRNAPWLISVQKTTDNTRMLAIESYICIFYIWYIIYTHIHSEKMLYKTCKQYLDRGFPIPLFPQPRVTKIH